MTTHEVLVAAKAYLLTHGWCASGWGDLRSDGPRCVVGSLLYVCDDESVRTAHLALIDAIGAGAMNWNDTPGRTFVEVIDALDRAILATAPAETPEPVTA